MNNLARFTFACLMLSIGTVALVVPTLLVVRDYPIDDYWLRAFVIIPAIAVGVPIGLSGFWVWAVIHDREEERMKRRIRKRERKERARKLEAKRLSDVRFEGLPTPQSSWHKVVPGDTIEDGVRYVSTPDGLYNAGPLMKLEVQLDG